MSFRFKTAGYILFSILFFCNGFIAFAQNNSTAFDLTEGQAIELKYQNYHLKLLMENDNGFFFLRKHDDDFAIEKWSKDLNLLKSKIFEPTRNNGKKWRPLSFVVRNDLLYLIYSTKEKLTADAVENQLNFYIQEIEQSELIEKDEPQLLTAIKYPPSVKGNLKDAYTTIYSEKNTKTAILIDFDDEKVKGNKSFSLVVYANQINPLWSTDNNLVPFKDANVHLAQSKLFENGDLDLLFEKSSWPLEGNSKPIGGHTEYAIFTYKNQGKDTSSVIVKPPKGEFFKSANFIRDANGNINLIGYFSKKKNALTVRGLFMYVIDKENNSILSNKRITFSNHIYLSIEPTAWAIAVMKQDLALKRMVETTIVPVTELINTEDGGILIISEHRRPAPTPSGGSTMIGAGSSGQGGYHMHNGHKHYGARWTSYGTGSTALQSAEICGSLLLVKLDKAGDTSWVREYSKYSSDEEQFNSYFYFLENDKIHLIYNENAKKRENGYYKFNAAIFMDVIYNLADGTMTEETIENVPEDKALTVLYHSKINNGKSILFFQKTKKTCVLRRIDLK